MKTLFLITARGGSKGIPRKNILDFCGKPLICWSIDAARRVTSDENICVSTDDQEIIDVVESYGLKVPFVRPAEYATDTASHNDVIVHAVKWYQEHGIDYDTTFLLQPTSPFRRKEDLERAMELYNPSIDEVLGVTKLANPFTLMHHVEGEEFIEPAFAKLNGTYIRRAIAPTIYENTGSIYVINNKALLEYGLYRFKKIRPCVIPTLYGVDIDTLDDWAYAEFLYKTGRITEL